MEALPAKTNHIVPEPGKASGAAFSIFRGADATDMRNSGAVSYSNLDETMLAALGRIQDAGGEEGSQAEHLFSAGGMSLGRVWFKSGFPLLLHSHDTNCLYYITAGSLRLGTQTLAAGDGFFVPADVPYSYTAGPEGVELLEFRTSEQYDFKIASRNPKYFDRLAGVLASQKSKWLDETRPGR
jgi:hypothetical protein